MRIRYNISDFHANRTDDSNRFSFVREIAERVVEQNNQLISRRDGDCVKTIKSTSSF